MNREHKGGRITQLGGVGEGRLTLREFKVFVLPNTSMWYETIYIFCGLFLCLKVMVKLYDYVMK